MAERCKAIAIIDYLGRILTPSEGLHRGKPELSDHTINGVFIKNVTVPGYSALIDKKITYVTFRTHNSIAQEFAFIV